MSVGEYMAWCLTGTRDGLLPQRQPARAPPGDFVTAPEVSQIFGELIAVWACTVWQAMGQPSPFVLAELGPGRGTLMQDALRAARAMPGFLEAAQIHLVETSATLREKQDQAAVAILPPAMA